MENETLVVELMAHPFAECDKTGLQCLYFDDGNCTGTGLPKAVMHCACVLSDQKHAISGRASR